MWYANVKYKTLLSLDILKVLLRRQFYNICPPHLPCEIWPNPTDHVLFILPFSWWSFYKEHGVSLDIRYWTLDIRISNIQYQISINFTFLVSYLFILYPFYKYYFTWLCLLYNFACYFMRVSTGNLQGFHFVLWTLPCTYLPGTMKWDCNAKESKLVD